MLVLRVDRGLEWLDVARVLFDADPSLPEGTLKAEVVRLRKRFQQVKAKIRKLAKEAGLVES